MDPDQDEFVRETWTKESLSGRDLGKRVFEECVFRHCRFNDASLKSSRFLDCRFEHCDLSNAAFDNATLRGPVFSDSKLVGVAWNRVQRLERPGFRDCVLNLGNFKGLALAKLALKDCVAKEADFSGADLREADFSGSDLAGSLFFHSDLRQADFRSARNYTLVPDQCKLTGARFSYPEVMALLHGLEIEIEN